MLNPNEPQMTPWEMLTKRWETEIAKRRVQNDFEIDPIQTEPQYQSHSFRSNNQATRQEQTQPQSFMPNNEAKTAAQQTQPWGFSPNHAKAGPHQTQTRDFNQPKAGHSQPKGFKPNKANNDKSKAGPQQTEPAQSSHISEYYFAIIATLSF